MDLSSINLSDVLQFGFSGLVCWFCLTRLEKAMQTLNNTLVALGGKIDGILSVKAGVENGGS